MEAAKAAVSKFTSNRGHHTSVEENVNPAITSETIKPHRHEEHTQATDREVHQHHYHTTVQPLSHKEHLPEKHTHNMLPTEHREFHHDNEHDTKTKVATELGRFKDSSTTHQTHHTQAAAPNVTGEHVHHHVHETVVPVIHKETVQPEVVHTTAPIHETHHAAAQHHGLSALPMKTLDEFKTGGGVLTGGNHGSHEEYEGQPRKYNEKMSTTFEKLGLGGAAASAAKSHHHANDSGVGGVGGDEYQESGHHLGQKGVGNNQYNDGNLGSSNATASGVGGTGAHHSSGLAGTTAANTSGRGDEFGNTQHGLGHSNTSGTHNDNAVDIARKDLGYDSNRGSGLNTSSGNTGLNTASGNNGLNTSSGSTGRAAETGDLNTNSKPSLMDRLNPRKDTTGDGKPGIMS